MLYYLAEIVKNVKIFLNIQNKINDILQQNKEEKVYYKKSKTKNL